MVKKCFGQCGKYFFIGQKRLEEKKKNATMRKRLSKRDQVLLALNFKAKLSTQGLAMKYAVVFMVAFFGCVTSQLLGDNPTATQNSIRWFTNYEEALNESKNTSKPLILFFTGKDWCVWCNKLEKEVFDTQEFAAQAGNSFVFLKLDFPSQSALPPQQNAQNKQLQKKYNVRSFPTLIVLDSTGQQQIGTTGYRSGGGAAYAAHLKKMVNDYNNYRQKLQSAPSQKLSGEELRRLYEKSKELDLPNDTNQLLKIGMESNLKHYFLTERYRFLADEGLIHSPEAVAIKQQLRTLDPNNEQHTQYDIALIEFEAYSEERDSNKDRALEPLIQYIARYGNNDKDNLWRLEMIVSQIYLDENQFTEALQHAQASYNASPRTVQNEIAVTIRNIESQINTKR